MYGIVNKAIQELVEQLFASAAWEKIRKRSGIAENYFSTVSRKEGADHEIYQIHW